MILTLFIILALSTLSYGLFTLFIIAGLLKRPRSERSERTPDVAVIMAARNEADKLEKILEDLVNQDYAGNLNIYVADDRSTDKTGKIIDRFSRQHTHFHAVKILKTSEHMTPKKHALTECIKQTTAELVLTTDADCRVGSQWVSSAVSQFTDDVGVLVGYSQVAPTSFFAKYQTMDFAAIQVANAGMMAHGFHWSGTGQNLAYRRSAFSAIGGYTAVADQITGDDIYLVRNIPSKVGLQAVMSDDPTHFAETLPQETFGEFMNQRIRWSSDSRGTHRNNPLFFTFLLSAFLSNAMILTLAVLGAWGPAFFTPLAIKFLVEGLVLILGARKFNFASVLWLYPFWFVLQPPYITYVGLKGLRGKFTWKP